MRSKGSRFTLGVWGLRVCSLGVAFTVATVRNRPCEDRMAVPMVSSAEVVIFGGFQRFVASFRVAGVALRDIQTCFVTCRKSFCVAGAILLRRFQRCVHFSWQAQHFGRVHRHFSWQAQHFRRVVLRVYCKSHWQGCVKWRQGANSGRRGILCDVLKIDGSLARNIDFEVANFQVLRKTCRKTSILKLQSVKIGGSLARNARFGAPTCLVSSLWFSCGVAVSMGEAAKLVLLSCCQLWKLEEVSHEMLVFLHPRVLSRVAGFPVASSCLWGKPQNLSFSKVSKQVVMSFCVAGVALYDIPSCLITCWKCQNWRKSRTKCSFFRTMRLVSSLWFSCGIIVSMGEAAKSLLFKGFQAGCHVVLRGRCGTSWHSNLFDNVLKISNLKILKEVS